MSERGRGTGGIWLGRRLPGGNRKRRPPGPGPPTGWITVPVSYTHLDVYKRQVLKFPVVILVREIPVQRNLFIPFMELAEILSHEQELLADVYKRQGPCRYRGRRRHGD